MQSFDCLQSKTATKRKQKENRKKKLCGLIDIYHMIDGAGQQTIKEQENLKSI